MQGILKLLLAFLGKKTRLFRDLTAAGLRAQHAVVMELLTKEHQLYRFAFTESNVNCKWDRVIFTDESTISSANDELVLVYRPQGECYNTQYMSACEHSGCVSVRCCGRIPMKWLDSPSYRGSPGRPAILAHFAERNGALCMDALS